MNTNYMEYLDYVVDNHSLFYEMNQLDVPDYNFKIPTELGPNWIDHNTDYWHYIINSKSKLPKQGWKIHITATPASAKETLALVSEYLVRHRISFKFLSNTRVFLLANSKYADRSESGKFITIYPKNQFTLRKIIKRLEKILADTEDGPYILSDQQWKNSNIFYRYGAFEMMETMTKDGLVPAIQTPDGSYIEDMRVPYFNIPDFVRIPRFLEKGVSNSDVSNSNLSLYNIINAIHFSNAGGVYLVEKNGIRYILKEGRPHAGLDGQGVDGFQRIRLEYDALMELENIDGIVNPIEYFTAWKHNYIVEELVKGNSINDYIVQNYPFNYHDSDVYAKNSIRIINQLLDIVTAVHQKGYALGDIQPSNILVNDTEGDDIVLKIIDVETLHKVSDPYNPGIATSGFINLNSSTFQQADYFAIFRIARYSFLPIESGAELSLNILDRQNTLLQKQFGCKVINYLSSLEEKLGINTANYVPQFMYKQLDVPKLYISDKSLDSTITNLIKGIVENLDLNSEWLTKGDIEQYKDKLSSYNIKNGSFGVLLSLKLSDELPIEVDSNIKHWISANFSEISKTILETNDRGFWTGSSGIGLVLIMYGFEAEGISFITTQVGPNDKNTSELIISATIAYKITKSPKLLEFIAQNSDNMSSSDKPALFGGKLSVALANICTYLVMKDDAYLIDAERIINKVISNDLISTPKGMFFKDDTSGDTKLLSYLNDGSAGLAFTIMFFDRAATLSQHNYNNFKSELADIMNTNQVSLSYAIGIEDGLSGLLLVDALADVLGFKFNFFSNKLEILNHFLLAQNESIFVPGRFSHKLSMDIATGAAGVLLPLILKKYNVNFI